MTHNAIPPNAIPDWFLQTVQVMQDTDHGVRNIDTELRHAMGLEGLDPGLRDDLQYIRDALGAVKISLSVILKTAVARPRS
jgi:hypothetical protein